MRNEISRLGPTKVPKRALAYYSSFQGCFDRLMHCRLQSCISLIRSPLSLVSRQKSIVPCPTAQQDQLALPALRARAAARRSCALLARPGAVASHSNQLPLPPPPAHPPLTTAAPRGKHAMHPTAAAESRGSLPLSCSSSLFALEHRDGADIGAQHVEARRHEQHR